MACVRTGQALLDARENGGYLELRDTMPNAAWDIDEVPGRSHHRSGTFDPCDTRRPPIPVTL
jgi:hypothetical protein